MKTQNNYRNNRYGSKGTYERDARTSDSNFRNRYDETNRDTYNSRFPEDTRGYSDAPTYGDGRGSRNSYNSDTHRDADSFNYRSSGGYGRNDNHDYSGRYDRHTQSYNDRYDMHSSGQWPRDRDRKTSRQWDESSSNRRQNDDNNSRRGAYDENSDYRNTGYNGRNASDYRNSAYGSGSYYNPSDNYGRQDGRGYTYRHDEDYDQENQRPHNKGRYSWGNTDTDRSKGDYGYYESYPSYGQSEVYGDHERYAGKVSGYQSRTDEYGETDPDNDYDRRRPNTRNRNSW